MMKKICYIVFVCGLSILMLHEFKKNFMDGESGSRTYIPTAHFLSKVQSENEKAGKKIAYLTFDDGPSEVTEQVLDVLKEKKVKATFFLIGEEITKSRESIVKREIAEGHGVGVHTQCHKQDKIYSDYASFENDFLTAYKKIEQVTGVYPEIHRFPWGSMNGMLKPFYTQAQNKLTQMGIRSYDWNCSGEDSVGSPSKQSILTNIKKDYGKYTQPIILLHDSNSTYKTAEVLGEIIDMIKKDGYEFRSLKTRMDSYIFPKEWRK